MVEIVPGSESLETRCTEGDRGVGVGAERPDTLVTF